MDDRFTRDRAQEMARRKAKGRRDMVEAAAFIVGLLGSAYLFHFAVPHGEPGSVGIGDLIWGIGSLAGGYFTCKFVRFVIEETM